MFENNLDRDYGELRLILYQFLSLLLLLLVFLMFEFDYSLFEFK